MTDAGGAADQRIGDRTKGHGPPALEQAGRGISPIMSMVRHLMACGVHSFRLFYCTRTPEATPL
jgi:ferredoxin-NADP reductase